MDALSAFAKTALADARRTAHGQPDWKVMEAFALGWQMAELYRPAAPEQAPPVQAGDLPDLSQLDAGQWTQIGLYQVQAGLTKLGEAIWAAGLDVPDAEELGLLLRDAPQTDREAVLTRFHVDLLAILTAADYRLGKAYGVGRALADATREGANYHLELQRPRVAVVAAWIRQLATAFPPHSSHAVAKSLECWSAWAADPPQSGEASEAQLLPHLAPEGRLWRSLLSGEKRAVDVLEQTDYLTAGEHMLKNAGKLARKFLRHYWWACLAVLVLFVIGVVVMFVVGNAAGVVSGAVTILAGVGFGWRTIGTSLGSAAARVESPLWGAALDEVIYERITPRPLVERASAR
jgi:hypothetical protein